jgi:hypothetical protein
MTTTVIKQYLKMHWFWTIGSTLVTGHSEADYSQFSIANKFVRTYLSTSVQSCLLPRPVPIVLWRRFEYIEEHVAFLNLLTFTTRSHF